MFPNPFVNHVNVKLSEWHRDLRVMIFDNEGKSILTQPIFSRHTMLNLSILPFGSYLIVVVWQNQVIRQFRIVKLIR
ncbi:MAG: T9SS type A sorting domain-containing protein [Bacteroidales bacterium]